MEMLIAAIKNRIISVLKRSLYLPQEKCERWEKLSLWGYLPHTQNGPSFSGDYKLWSMMSEHAQWKSKLESIVDLLENIKTSL